MIVTGFSYEYEKDADKAKLAAIFFVDLHNRQIRKVKNEVSLKTIEVRTDIPKGFDKDSILHLGDNNIQRAVFVELEKWVSC